MNIYLAAVSTFIATIVPAKARAFGPGSSGGGDICELEFKGLISSAGDWLEKNKQLAGLQIGFHEFAAAILKLKISCADNNVLVGGNPKTDFTDLNV